MGGGARVLGGQGKPGKGDVEDNDGEPREDEDGLVRAENAEALVLRCVASDVDAADEVLRHPNPNEDATGEEELPSVKGEGGGLSEVDGQRVDEEAAKPASQANEEGGAEVVGGVHVARAHCERHDARGFVDGEQKAVEGGVALQNEPKRLQHKHRGGVLDAHANAAPRHCDEVPSAWGGQGQAGGEGGGCFCFCGG